MSVSSQRKVLLIGGGFTGATIASMLQGMDDISVSVFEQSGQLGGRMCTRGFFDNEIQCDIGAQFVTKTPAWSDAAVKLHEKLVKQGLLRQLDTDQVVGNDPYLGDESTHFVASKGIGEIVNQLYNESEANIHLNTQVSDVILDGDQWKVELTDGECSHFDVVVSTIPKPDCLLSTQSTDLQSAVESTIFSTRVGLVAEINENVDWTAMYVDGVTSDKLRYICCDSNKKTNGERSPTVIMAHSSVPFAMKTKANDDELKLELEQELVQVLGMDMDVIVRSELFKWPISQLYRHQGVTDLMKEQQRTASVLVNNTPLFLLGGDGFGGSGFIGCVDSADEIASSIVIPKK